MIKIEGISFSFDDINYSSQDEREVLKDISFNIKRGEKVVILGTNGSGKSTLLKLLNGLISPQKGAYFYKNHLVTPSLLKEKDFHNRFRKEVVFLFQNPDTMIFNPTVFDEIAFGLRQLEVDAVEDRVNYWAEKLRISKYLHLSPFKLSAGKKQMVCLASLLVLEPELLLLDEPTSNLDPATTGWFIELLQELDVTTLIATHNLSLSMELGNRGVVLSDDHRMIYDGALENLIKDVNKLIEANLVHRHKHKHTLIKHTHYHTHDWD